MIALEGTQATFNRPPPSSARSTSATLKPKAAASRRGQAAGAGADNDQIVAAGRFGIDPVKRAHLVKQGAPITLGSRMAHPIGHSQPPLKPARRNPSPI